MEMLLGVRYIIKKDVNFTSMGRIQRVVGKQFKAVES